LLSRLTQHSVYAGSSSSEASKWIKSNPVSLFVPSKSLPVSLKSCRYNGEIIQNNETELGSWLTPNGAIANLVDELGGAVAHLEGLPLDVSVDMSISYLSNAHVNARICWKLTFGICAFQFEVRFYSLSTVVMLC
ncbi:uncharacterized protein LOC114736321, partial [Neltuma alba]|uniref:uncharacterized protein LOC114736321 n=1 Tax=Neltuma alba TaxID=207710 RepID=UPI0010A4525F